MFKVDGNISTIPDYSYFVEKGNEFELIEEQQDIDVQAIEELDEETAFKGNGLNYNWTEKEKVLALKINQILQWAKQVDKSNNKRFCHTCGTILDEKNTALPNMCKECKYGEEK